MLALMPTPGQADRSRDPRQIFAIKKAWPILGIQFLTQLRKMATDAHKIKITLNEEGTFQTGEMIPPQDKSDKIHHLVLPCQSTKALCVFQNFPQCSHIKREAP